MKRKCPICGTLVDSEIQSNFPFCSERCRQHDLGNWATEKYVVSDPVFDEEELERTTRKTIILDLDEMNDSHGDKN